jgi:hypothetical protein
VSEGYQTTGHRNFWAFAVSMVLVVSAMAVSDWLGHALGSIWIAVILGFSVGIASRLINKKIVPLESVLAEDQTRWWHISSPLIGVLIFGLLSGEPRYYQIFVGGAYLALGFEQLHIWYKTEKVD